MKTKLTLKIHRRTQPGWLVWVLFILPLMLGTLNDLMGLPYAVRYLLDVVWLLLLGYMVRMDQPIKCREMAGLLACMILFLTYTLLMYVIRFQSAFYYLWGVRNNFRFYIAFLAFVCFLKENDIEYYLGILDKLFWGNVTVSFIQFFVFGYEQDQLGGIFGVVTGVNAYTNLFFLIVLTKDILLYLEKREKVGNCISKCVAALIVAALAELKFFFMELMLVILLVSLINRITWRKFLVTIGGVLGIAVGVTLLTAVFPRYEGWFTFETMLETALSDKGYTSSGDLNRLNAIPQINELWLTTWGERLFGLGLGNCDTSSFAIVNTPFYETYGDMHYTWISYAFMYLECGWVGLIFYFGFFVLVYFNIRKIEKRSEGIAKTYCRMGRIMAIMCMIIAVYNSSLRTEAAYMAYFVLAIPFVFDKERKKGERDAERVYKKSLAERKVEFR